MRRRFMNSHKTFDYSKYMTIEVLEDGYEVYFLRDVEYNLNGHKWVILKAGSLSPTLKKGDLLSLRCSLAPGETFGNIRGNNKAINLRGNILSLIFKDNINLDISGYGNVFDQIFDFYLGNNIVSVEKNFLPATTLAINCYYYMFRGCKNLVNAPELPATTLEINCYYGMFSGCTSLTNAPELPARTLASRCYSYMFYGCSKLNYIKMLATEATAQNCLLQWVNGVASTGNFVKHPDMNSLPTGVSGIPSGWTVVNDEEESGGNLITFTIDGTEYQAEEGMTWREFVASEYNTVNELGDKYFRNADGIIQYAHVYSEDTPDGIDCWTEYIDVYKNYKSAYNNVFSDEYIREDINYII